MTLVVVARSWGSTRIDPTLLTYRLKCTTHRPDNQRPPDLRGRHAPTAQVESRHRSHKGIPAGKLLGHHGPNRAPNPMVPNRGGGLVKRLSLVDTPHCSEHGTNAVTPAPTFRPSEGIPPLGPKNSKRGKQNERKLKGKSQSLTIPGILKKRQPTHYVCSLFSGYN